MSEKKPNKALYGIQARLDTIAPDSGDSQSIIESITHTANISDDELIQLFQSGFNIEEYFSAEEESVRSTMIEKLEKQNTVLAEKLKAALLSAAVQQAPDEVQIAEGKTTSQPSLPGESSDVDPEIISEPGSFSIQLTSDEMAALLTIIPAQGVGRPVYLEEVMEEVTRKNIIFGLHKENLKSIIESAKKNKEPAEGIIIAQGRQKMIGRNGETVILLHDPPLTLPRDLEVIEAQPEQKLKLMVERDQTIAECIPAQKGVTGMTVTGKELPAKEVSDFSLKPRVNVDFNFQKYTAHVKGQAIITKNSISVRRYMDGYFAVHTTQDERKALLSIVPPLGEGKPVTHESITAYLKENGIMFGIDHKAIQSAVDLKDHVEDLIIARAQEPVHGDDGRVEYKIRLASGNRFRIQKNGNVDFHEQDIVTKTKTGTLLAVYYMPTEGKEEGHTVYGTPIPAQPGRPYTFDGYDNIEIKSFDDRIEYYSTINGQVKTDRSSISVQPILTIDGNVDYSTGNVDFDGNVVIQGNVEDDFKISATGDLIVHGNIMGAHIHVQGDVYARSGIIMRKKGSLTVEGNLHARFIENSIITVHGDMTVAQTIIQSHILCMGHVSIKKEKGRIIGGVVRAMYGIEANTLGADTGVKTVIMTGLNFVIADRLESVREKMSVQQNNLQQLNQIIDKLFSVTKEVASFTPEMKSTYVTTLKKVVLVKAQQHELRLKEMKLITELNKEINGDVIVQDVIYPDVIISIRGARLNARNAMYGARLTYDNAEGVLKVLENVSSETEKKDADAGAADEIKPDTSLTNNNLK